MDMIVLKPHQVVMSCELEDAESFYRFWEGLAYDRIMIQVITTGSFIEGLSEYFEGYAYKVTKLAKREFRFESVIQKADRDIAGYLFLLASINDDVFLITDPQPDKSYFSEGKLQCLTDSGERIMWFEYDAVDIYMVGGN
ncbi:YxiK [Bacillus sp. JS]|nr:YxiK [Bacillus sp. JS]